MKQHRIALALGLVAVLAATQSLADNPDNPKFSWDVATVATPATAAVHDGRMMKTDSMKAPERMVAPALKPASGWTAGWGMALKNPDANDAAPN